MKNMIKWMLRKTDRVSRPRTAYAHCDIPCGIYETDSMKWDADTVFVLTEKLMALERPDDAQAKLAYKNAATRMIEIKERHAQHCKEQILILWTDYFKPEHFRKYPDLSEKTLNAAKQCSIVKREVNMEAAGKLKEMVAEIARIFAETKK